ncbi:putative ribonuclease H protein At1g65750 family [Senna tora]|uniref:Putative ribonuclease H protein At1g65750 family n=1 Tax=Senna tora TaxID=362788 RepID=A0A835C5A2_9FABA|nr:putative ribonuclease H protein At1g65750 family [Senna tora]
MVHSRLSAWKSHCLSLAGRDTLVKAVTLAIPTYLMQIAVILASMCNEVEKKNRAFIWGSTETHRKVHLVAWEKVCKTKHGEGLGIRNMRAQNDAFMKKLGWGLINQRGSLWVRVLCNKYNSGDDIVPRVIKGSNPSSLWK